MELANGYTTGQVFVAYLEGTLSTPLKLQWRKCSARCVDPPSMDVFTAFLKEQRKVTSSTCVTPIRVEKSHPPNTKHIVLQTLLLVLQPEQCFMSKEGVSVTFAKLTILCFLVPPSETRPLPNDKSG